VYIQAKTVTNAEFGTRSATSVIN